MANEPTYLIRGAAWLAQALGETAEPLSDFYTDYLGLDLTDAVRRAPNVADALRKCGAAATKVSDAGTKIEKVAVSAKESDILLAFLELGTALTELFLALDELARKVRDAIPAAIPDPTAAAAASHFADDLAKHIADYAIASLLTDRLPELGFALKLMGLLEWQYTPADATHDLARSHVRKSLQLDRVKDLISDPRLHFERTLKWGTKDFYPLDVFRLAAELFPPESDVTVGLDGQDPFIRSRVLVQRDSSLTPPGLLASFTSDLSTSVQTRVSINEQWDVGISSDLVVTGEIDARVRPPLAVSLTPKTGSTISGDARTFFERNEKKRPFDIVGGTGLVSLSAQNLTAGVALKASWNGTAATIDPLLFAKLDQLTLKLGADKADSFVASLLSRTDIQGTFDLGLEWAMSTGLKISASGGIEIALPIHKQLGPIEFATLYLALRIQNTGNLALEISSAIVGNLGPLQASVDRIGAALDLKFSEKADGKQGMFDVDLRFKPPNGIGIAIDAGVVKGGGFLSIDVERGEYAGALELTIADFISVKAIGLITTKLPDGSSGFTLLIIITAEFGSGIQLGFGFTLLGVGGLLGVNRGARLEALVEGVRSGAIDRILFPRNVVANAPQIISDLRNFFPAEAGTFLIGPMAKIGWGTPTLIRISLGVIIEIPPGNIIILGVLKVILPTEEAAILKLQVNFIGAMEPAKKRIWFFAALFDSRVVFLTIEGGMGLLIAFGDDANFVISVGGFHPHFQPPRLPFPVPKRVSVSLIDTDYARIRIEGYFAVTSNTVQFGAKVDVYFGLSAINIKGHLAFDALFQFSPFYFIITISASFSLNIFGASLLSVKVEGSLEGPTPWHVQGTARFRILFFNISADIDVVWGEERHDALQPIAVLPLLRGELQKKENWRAQLPASNNLLVSLRPLPEDSTLVLHPVGVLHVSQRAVPLGLTLDKVGNKKPSDVTRVTLRVKGGLERKNDVYEQFAPAQYQNFSDSAKLSRPAYTSERAGLEMSAAGTGMRSSRMVRRAIRYEEIVLDGAARSRAGFRGAGASLFDHFVNGAAITRSELSASAKAKLDPFAAAKVSLQPAAYAVVLQANNRAFNLVSGEFPSEASAREFLASEVARDPNLAETLQVIPAAELVAA